MRPSPAGSKVYDVAVLGSGIGSTLLATLLARHGVAVLVLEAGTHPRFALGESTTPEASLLLKNLARRFDVPEVAHLATFQKVRHHISSSCGVKRAFSFLYHRQGQPLEPCEVHQFATFAPPLGPDIHYFRQDLDSYMLTVAARYGACIVQQCAIEECDLERGVWTLGATDGRRFHARYLADGTGPRSLLARRFELRDEPCRLRTDSRTLFTHMVGVRPFDQVSSARSVHGMPIPFHQGTVHHLFDGGWFWVIPFDNVRGSTNGLTSVGLQFDRRKFPDRGLSPEEEFRNTVEGLPTVAEQFEEAQAIRPWVAIQKMQYSSKRVTGERYCLLSHTAGFVDPLYSTGLAMTFATVGNLATRLIGATHDGDFSTERFRLLEDYTQHHLDRIDFVVSHAYDSWADFKLWNGWMRVVSLSNFYGAAGRVRDHLRYLENKDPDTLGFSESVRERGYAASDCPEVIAMQTEAARLVDEAVAPGGDPAAAGDAIMDLLRRLDFAPSQFRIGDPRHRWFMTFTVLPLLRFLLWMKFQAPKRMRQRYFDYGPRNMARYVLRVLFDELRASTRTSYQTFRDSFRAWNRESDAPRGKRRAAAATVGVAAGSSPSPLKERERVGDTAVESS